MLHVEAYNVPRAYEGMLWQMKIHGREEDSRGGKVLTVQGPTCLTITNPTERVLFDPIRNANPFFHLMEAIWMLAGENDVSFLLDFNKSFKQFAEPDGHQRGAYGFRWRYHFGTDQLLRISNVLRQDPGTRRAVLAMWDPGYDLEEGYRDYPCNTHIYWRITDGHLNMTVCNRSNDLIWGMLGANTVHMTVLHEVMATAVGVKVGKYHAFTNNLHVYTEREDFQRIWSSPWVRHDRYAGCEPFPIMAGNEDIRTFLSECTAFVRGYWDGIGNLFLRHVAMPMYQAYMARQNRVSDGLEFIRAMPERCDWKLAGEEWIARKISSSLTSTAPLPSTTTETTSSESSPSDGKSTSTSATSTPSTIP